MKLNGRYLGIIHIQKEAEFLKLSELNKMLEKLSYIQFEVNGTLYKVSLKLDLFVKYTMIVAAKTYIHKP